MLRRRPFGPLNKRKTSLFYRLFSCAGTFGKSPDAGCLSTENVMLFDVCYLNSWSIRKCPNL
jgi:hypothetical protein